MSEHVEVIGTGSASGTPDVVVIDARIQCEEGGVAAALGSAATRTGAALSAAADHGVADVDRRTTGMGIGTRWDPQGGGIVGYTAHQTLRLTVRDRDRAGAVLHALAGAAGDALGIDAVTLDMLDPAPLLREARSAAFADARTRAEQYAALAGRDLGPVLRVSEAPLSHEPAPRMLAAKMESGASMPVEPGESVVTTSVLVRFGLG